MTMKEVADWLRVSEKTIQRWIKAGAPVHNIGSPVRPDWRFDREKVITWIDAGKPPKQRAPADARDGRGE